MRAFQNKNKRSQNIPVDGGPLNGIETMFSQLAKQSHWKLSADSSIAHEHILPVNLPVNTFSTENEKMAVEGKSLALLLVSYFLLRKKFSLLK